MAIFTSAPVWFVRLPEKQVPDIISVSLDEWRAAIKARTEQRKELSQRLKAKGYVGRSLDCKSERQAELLAAKIKKETGIEMTVSKGFYMGF